MAPQGDDDRRGDEGADEDRLRVDVAPARRTRVGGIVVVARVAELQHDGDDDEHDEQGSEGDVVDTPAE